MEAIRRALAGAKKIAVVDRNFSFGATGIFAQELRAALCNVPITPRLRVHRRLGGRDITTEVLASIVEQTKTADAPPAESIWIGLTEAAYAFGRP